MTVGKDVSMLFTDVVNCIQTGNIELKKLVYLYLINYAKSQPDLALLAVNTFVKDANDPNPLMRALAVRPHDRAASHTRRHGHAALAPSIARAAMHASLLNPARRTRHHLPHRLRNRSSARTLAFASYPRPAAPLGAHDGLHSRRAHH